MGSKRINARFTKVVKNSKRCRAEQNQDSAEASPSEMGSERPQSPWRASSRSFCTACGSTEPSLTGPSRRLPRNQQTRSQGSRSTAGKHVPAGTMAVVRSPDFLRALNQRDCACNIDPPASSYAIMRRAGPYRGENSGPGKDNRGELDTKTRN